MSEHKDTIFAAVVKSVIAAKKEPAVKVNTMITEIAKKHKFPVEITADIDDVLCYFSISDERTLMSPCSLKLLKTHILHVNLGFGNIVTCIERPDDWKEMADRLNLGNDTIEWLQWFVETTLIEGDSDGRCMRTNK